VDRVLESIDRWRKELGGLEELACHHRGTEGGQDTYLAVPGKQARGDLDFAPALETGAFSQPLDFVPSRRISNRDTQ
jgi:hypothetical protein